MVRSRSNSDRLVSETVKSISNSKGYNPYRESLANALTRISVLFLRNKTDRLDIVHQCVISIACTLKNVATESPENSNIGFHRQASELNVIKSSLHHDKRPVLRSLLRKEILKVATRMPLTQVIIYC